jgi:hypothetical protein
MSNFPKIRILAIYWGKLPMWFPLWVESCTHNPEFSFLIAGNQDPASLPVLPGNVEWLPLSPDAFKDRVRAKLSLEPCIPAPYKLCDFRPAYGLLFDDQLAGYDFWGFCDLDVLWGRLAHFITPEILNTHDRILTRGHLTLIRNTDSCVRAFMLPSSAPDHRHVFTHPANFIYDEWPGIHLAFSENDFRIFLEEVIADIDPQPLRFNLTRHPNFPDQCFIWREGQVLQCHTDPSTGTIVETEFAYLHFQKRRMNRCTRLSGRHGVAITPRGFVALKHPLKSGHLFRYNRPLPLITRIIRKNPAQWRILLGAWKHKIVQKRQPGP